MSESPPRIPIIVKSSSRVANKEKSFRIREAHRNALRGQQMAIYECFLCKHAFPAEFMLFVDDIICQDRHGCMQRKHKKYQYYVRAKEAESDWWHKIYKKTKNLAFHPDADSQVVEDIEMISFRMDAKDKRKKAAFRERMKAEAEASKK